MKINKAAIKDKILKPQTIVTGILAIGCIILFVLSLCPQSPVVKSVKHKKMATTYEEVVKEDKNIYLEIDVNGYVDVARAGSYLTFSQLMDLFITKDMPKFDAATINCYNATIGEDTANTMYVVVYSPTNDIYENNVTLFFTKEDDGLHLRNVKNCLNNTYTISYLSVDGLYTTQDHPFGRTSSDVVCNNAQFIKADGSEDYFYGELYCASEQAMEIYMPEFIEDYRECFINNGEAAEFLTIMIENVNYYIMYTDMSEATPAYADFVDRCAKRGVYFSTENEVQRLLVEYAQKLGYEFDPLATKEMLVDWEKIEG